VLIIPKQHVVGLKEATAEDAEIIGYSQLIAAKIARERGIEDGTAPCTTSARGRGSRCSPAPAHARGAGFDVAAGVGWWLVPWIRM